MIGKEREHIGQMEEVGCKAVLSYPAGFWTTLQLVWCPFGWKAGPWTSASLRIHIALV